MIFIMLPQTVFYPTQLGPMIQQGIEHSDISRFEDTVHLVISDFVPTAAGNMAAIVSVSIPSTNGLHVAFTTAWKCLKFYGCDYWKPATGVYWDNLPDDAFIAFHESTTCYAGGSPKTRVYYSNPATMDNTHVFQTPMSIRSMMVGFDKNYTRRPSVIYYNGCRLDDLGGEFENGIRVGVTDDDTVKTTTNSSDQWSGDDASADGSLSSNWTALLPE
ncbi:hypothetical protein JG687_00002186 [Phytophthora cactorum]|uniref:Uncharacterized protein n=3 Tax=Phytophthora cactorum TaxID=29920 RepID=A0A8T1UV96_9STRA|nr:hypothetical protein JG687_00002186 [Phytophthora cactorum]